MPTFYDSSLLNCSLSHSSMLTSKLSFPLNSVLLGCYCLKTTDLTLIVCLWQEERKSKWGSMGQAWHYTWIYIIHLTFDLDLTLYILHRDSKLFMSKIQLHSFSQSKPIPPVVFPISANTSWSLCPGRYPWVLPLYHVRLWHSHCPGSGYSHPWPGFVLQLSDWWCFHYTSSRSLLSTVAIGRHNSSTQKVEAGEW